MPSSLTPTLTVPHKTSGYLLAAAGAALFSTKAIFIKLAYEVEVNAALMLAYRMIFALPFFIAIGLWALNARRRRGEAGVNRQHAAQAMALGFAGYYLASYFDFAGLQYISAQLERLVLFTYPIMIMFLSAVIRGERLTRHGLTAALVTYAGLGLAFASDLPSGHHDTVLGTLLVLLAALSFAIHQIYARPLISALGSALYTSISMISASVCCIVHQAVVSGGNFNASPRFMGLTAACAIAATVLPSLLINASLARISSTSVAMISTLSPIVTIALAVIILVEPFTLTDAAGAVLVIFGVGIYTHGHSRAV